MRNHDGDRRGHVHHSIGPPRSGNDDRFPSFFHHCHWRRRRRNRCQIAGVIGYLIGPLHRPAADLQSTPGRSHLVIPPFAIGFSGNRHHIGIFKALVAAIGHGQPGEQIHLCCLIWFALLDRCDIIGLPVKAGCQIGQGQFDGHGCLRSRQDRQGRFCRQAWRQFCKGHPFRQAGATQGFKAFFALENDAAIGTGGDEHILRAGHPGRIVRSGNGDLALQISVDQALRRQ